MSTVATVTITVLLAFMAFSFCVPGDLPTASRGSTPPTLGRDPVGRLNRF